MSARHAAALDFGAEPAGAGRVRFSLWAPAAREVSLDRPGAAPLPMQGQADGMYRIIAECGAGTRYRYRVDGKPVPDPASRGQHAGDAGNWSLVVDPRSYAWVHDGWRGRPWRESVIYEAHAGCLGGFAGLRQRLPQLAELGVTVLELMPIGDFTGRRNWGYDGVLPYAPDAAYGKPEELKALVDAAHGLGLGVYLDVVYNHFGPEGNYLQLYAPQFFDAQRHSPWGPAIDFSQPRVREFFIGNAIYWLMEYRFDGLRLDAVHAIGDSSFLDELAARARAAAEPGRHIHLILENERNDAARLERGYDAQWNDDFHNALHVLLTGEGEGYYANYREAPAPLLARCLAEGFAYQGQASPGHGGRPRGTPSAQLPSTSFVSFLQNHDQVGNRALGERLTTLVGARALRAAISLLLLAPHIPLIFMGEEWAASEPFLYFTDFHGELAAAVREGRRREFAGFSDFADAARRAAIPDPNDENSFLRSIPAANSTGLQAASRFRMYRELLNLRRAAIVPRLEGTASLGAAAVGASAATAAWRLGDGARLWIGLNLGREPVPAAMPPGSLLYESEPGCAVHGGGGLGLAPESCCAFLEAA